MKDQKIDQEPLILEIYQQRFRPTLSIQQVDAETVDQADRPPQAYRQQDGGDGKVFVVGVGMRQAGLGHGIHGRSMP